MNIDGEKLLAELDAKHTEALDNYGKARNLSQSDYEFYKSIVLSEVIVLINSGDYTTKDGQS